METKYLKAAFNTITASWWEIWLARIFGTRQVGVDPCGRVTAYRWRGKHYIIDFEAS